MLVIAAAACASAGPRLTDSKGVVDAYLAARAEHETDAALELVADDAALALIRYDTQPASKTWLREYLSLPGISFEVIGSPEASGERVGWTERVSFPADVEEDDHYARRLRTFSANVEAVVRSGRIVSLLEKHVSAR